MSSSADELSDEPEPASESYTPRQYSQQNQPDGRATPQASAGETQNEADHDDPDEYSDRENRFEGPSSTWYKYTADERGLAASLDHQRAGDLGIHLYNTHALKARLRDPQLAAAAQPWHSKQRWIPPDEDGKKPWHPDPHWTAWPLPADVVPRKEETFSAAFTGAVVEEGTYRKFEAWKPSTDLQDELQAVMSRKAKERFRRRKWGEEGRNVSPQAGTAGEQDDGEEGKPSTARETHHAKPILLTDDDQAKAILQPSIRHIISQFDNLLIGLHKSRAGHRRPHSTSQSRSRSKPSASRSRSRSKTPAAARGRSGRRRKTTADSDSEPKSASDEADVDIDDERAASTKKRRRSGAAHHDLGLRDWSEVIGMASLVGWDPAVVDRAAKRCASLFGEGMALRIMPETAAGRSRDEIVEYRPQMVPDLYSETEDADGPSADEEDERKGMLYCPYEDCARHHAAYPIPWRWREHLRKKHKLNPGQVAEMEQRLGFSRDTTGLGTRSENPDDGREILDGEGEEQAEQSGAASESESDTEMDGGVHADGFMRPILAQAVHRGRDAKPRRTLSTSERQEQKRQKMAHVQDAEEEDVNADESEEDEDEEDRYGDFEMRHPH